MESIRLRRRHEFAAKSGQGFQWELELSSPPFRAFVTACYSAIMLGGGQRCTRLALPAECSKSPYPLLDVGHVTS